MVSENPTGSNTEATQSRQCNLRLLYLRDLSFESPHVPGILLGHEQPDLKMTVESSHKMRDKDIYEVLLEVSVHAMAGEKSLFLIEVKQGGVFEITGYSTDETLAILKTKAMEALYPYARELISSLASRGGFPRLQLRPLNFEALYAEAKQGRIKV